LDREDGFFTNSAAAARNASVHQSVIGSIRGSKTAPDPSINGSIRGRGDSISARGGSLVNESLNGSINGSYFDAAHLVSAPPGYGLPSAFNPGPSLNFNDAPQLTSAVLKKDPKLTMPFTKTDQSRLQTWESGSQVEARGINEGRSISRSTDLFGALRRPVETGGIAFQVSLRSEASYCELLLLSVFLF
jgi:hypothetical protein